MDPLYINELGGYGAPRQPDEEHQTETAENTEDDGAHQPVEWTFELRWMVSGNRIRVVRNTGEVDCERLAQYLDAGLFENDGAPRAKTDSDGSWWESYRLFYNGVELKGWKKFSYYGIPNKGATIDVIKILVETDRAYMSTLM